MSGKWCDSCFIDDDNIGKVNASCTRRSCVAQRWASPVGSMPISATSWKAIFFPSSRKRAVCALAFPAEMKPLVEYVRTLDFDRDVILGWRDAEFVLGGVVHLARVTETLVEFSISVLERYRGNGYGQRMTNEAFDEAAKYGFDHAHVQFIAANRRMAAILDHYHAMREQAGTERMVHVPLPARLSRPLEAPLGPFVPVWFD